jgi:L-threonylcarbamoyladenylate synthase
MSRSARAASRAREVSHLTAVTVPIDAVAPDPAVLARAAAVLRARGLVAFPTETFYGLGAAGLDRSAVRRVFELKGRPSSSPLLVLVDGVEMAERIAVIPDRAHELIARHWPGALTLVVTARDVVPDEVTAGTGKVGVRLSSHPVATGLVRALAEPITAPSANPSRLAPPTSAAAVQRDFGGTIEMILDAGDTAGGLPSTVLDMTVAPPRVIRAGAVKV